MAQKLLDIYSDSLITQNQYATATNLAYLLDGAISHDKITRFLNENQFEAKHVWSYVKKYVRKYEQTQGAVLIIDNSIEEKPYTDENKIVCWHYSHAKGRQVKGINLISCLVRYEDIAFPISFDVVCKEVDFVDPATGKTKRRASITKNQRFRALIKRAIKNQVKI